MNIGFDAKRLFHNTTGLGNYSRTLVTGLAQFYPEHQYFLFNPKPSHQFSKPALQNVHEVAPQNFLPKKFSSLWRSSWVKRDLVRNKIALYHGLSHEIPVGIQYTGIKSVVTIHDLIFERYPEQFRFLDVQIYRRKFRYACTHADSIIAISKQTKEDLINLYNVAPDKIHICYQSCHPAFGKGYAAEEKEALKKKLHLPDQFFLYVGSVIERKNLLTICKALAQVSSEITIPLLVLGNGKEYKQKVKDYLRENGLESRVIFLSEKEEIATILRSPQHMAVIYQLALALIYPSIYEGFGLPVLEALWSGLPVITSNVSCMPETGGDAALYINPASKDELAAALKRIYDDEALRQDMIERGRKHAQNFKLENCCRAVMEVYQKLL